ncbi:DsrE/DsrF/DrsH-like family protein [Bacillus sp. JJ1764]|uniref:DsrE/DsrF/DrsH-like family protein n=1 Tax=Bacillus sp. JJ1764 TaxID=3122964 RepID=UPI002FFEDFB5
MAKTQSKIDEVNKLIEAKKAEIVVLEDKILSRKDIMKKHNALTLPQLIEMAQEQDVKLVACTMTMDLLGLKEEELLDHIEYAGVAAYLADAEEGNVNLFI